MMRQLLVIVVLLTTSLGITSMAAAETTWVCPEGFEGQTLRVFNWADYVAETTIPDFEAACGVTVEYFEYGTNDELLTVLQAGTADYDIIIPSAYLVRPLSERGLIQELDHSLIPNIENIGPIIDALPLDEGHVYSVPYQWGTIGFLSDSTVVETPITSWEEFLAYEGRVVWVDDSRLMLNIALLKLGYEFNSTDEAQIQEASQYLLDNTKSDIFAITVTGQADLLLSGEVDAVVTASRYAVQVAQECECEDYVYAFPSDGFVGFYDAMLIPTTAPNPALAHAFMDYILDPQVSANISNAIGSGAPNSEATPFLSEEILNNGISYPDTARVQQFLDETIIMENVGQVVTIYTQVWNELKAELVNN